MSAVRTTWTVLLVAAAVAGAVVAVALGNGEPGHVNWVAVLVAPITATALKSAPERYAGIASGINTTFSRVGNLLAVAVTGLVITLVFESSGGSSSAVPIAKDQTDAALREASIDAWRAGMLVVALLAFAGGAVALVGISNREARAEAAEPTPPVAAAAET